MADNSIHYVKFYRGSTTAFELLKTNNRLDSDTLYFVYTNANATKGLLYLGDKLISGSVDGSGSVLTDIALEDLVDVTINDASLANYQILVYEDDEWVNKSLSEIIETAVSVMEGPTLVSPGKSGLVPQPRVGDDTKFLRGDGTWASINIPTFDANQFSESATGNIILKGSLSANNGQLLASDGNGGIKWVNAPTGTLTRTIVSSVEDIDLTEVDKIYLVRKPAEEEAENDRFEEYMIIDGNIELLGSFSTDINLENYATKTFVNNSITPITNVLNGYSYEDSNTGETITVPGLIPTVNTLVTNQTLIGNLNQFTTEHTLVDEIDAINERLAWQELDS